jgi:beta-glucosidase
MVLLILLFLFAGLFKEGNGKLEEDFPFRNVTLDWSVRVDDLVSRLSAHEIIDQMVYGSVWDERESPPIPRLGILSYRWGAECLRGLRGENSTGFPQAINLASTWNKELVKAVANATAYEVHAHYNAFRKESVVGVHYGLSCFSPVVNIMRHPLWGRNQETYGECPYLTGMFAIYFVHGLQGPPSARYLNTNAGCKHFDSHNGPENIPVSRFSFDVKLSEFNWRSTFLPAFHACVNAGTYSIMCSYNSINGIPSCANTRLLTDILRTGMNFTGYVVADDDALVNIHTAHHYVNTSEEAAIVALNAGVNLELYDSPSLIVFELLHQAYNEGKIDNKTLIERVKPLMYTRMRLGEFDPIEMNDYNQISMDIIQSELHRNLARQTTLQSFVLLKNQNHFLPIRNSKIFPNVLFLGPMSNNSLQQYGDYFPTVNPDYVTTPLSSLQDHFLNISYNQACLDGTKCLKYNQTDLINYLKMNIFDLIILSLGTGQDIESEGNDRASMNLPNNQTQLLQDVLNIIDPDKTKILFLIISASPLDIQIAEQSNSIQAIIQLGFGAQELGTALQMAIIGEGISKFGRLPYTWPKKLSDLPGDITQYDMTSGFTYRYSNVEPLYRFGYGLSYSNFSYNNLSFNATTIQPGNSLTIYFDVKNIGQRVSDEVVQIYLSIHLKNTSLTNVSRAQLVDFNRLSDMNPLEIVHYQAIIKPEQMAVYIDGKGFMIVPAVLEFKIENFIQPYLSGNVTIDGQDYYVGQYISYASI